MRLMCPRYGTMELPRTIVSSMRPTLEQDPEIPTHSPVGDHRQQDLSTTRSEPSEGSSEDPAPSTVPRRLTNSRKRKATLSPSPDLVTLANQILMQQTNTGMGSFANFAADRLRKLEDRQRIHAERVIFETLCKAATGQLDETSTLNSRIDRDPCSLQSRTQMPEPLRSTPVRRIGPPQNLPLGTPQSIPCFLSLSFHNYLLRPGKDMRMQTTNMKICSDVLLYF
ncbi:uncharacterized protein [Phyllobates terribilis]|uniref:uncharacterized protein n=1 Tax=Phyllobates terribilis TaxID=111132 RepID=UPI003CCAD7B6